MDPSTLADAGIVILIPVLRRPWRARPVAEAFASSTARPFSLLFLCSPGDEDEIAAVRATGCPYVVAPFPVGPGDWARKINLGYQLSTEPLMLLCGDDVDPHPGWAEEVRRAAAQGYGVIGTNDLGNSEVTAGAFSTHPVVARHYADEHGTIDGPGRVVDEGYQHNFVDNELAGTAQARGAWCFCSLARVEHLHPSWGKAPFDDVYTLGRSGFEADRHRFWSRRNLWMRP